MLAKRSASRALNRYFTQDTTLEYLLLQGLLPMGRYGVRVLDVGTGPGPSAFATHDFYAALENYAHGADASDWQQPSDITCVECAPSMNRIRHFLAEHLFSTGAPRSVLGMARGLHDFCAIRPTHERRRLEHNLRNQYEEYYDEHREEWQSEPPHTPEEANRASSAESVGEFWFGQVAKCVIQSDFQCPGGAEPIRPFGDHSGLSVEAFDNATGELPPGSEPVQNQVAVRAQPCGQPPSSGRAASASSGCTSGRGTGRPSTATRSPTAIESPP